MMKPISGAMALSAFLISLPAASANLSYTPEPADFIVNIGVETIAVLTTGHALTFDFVANGSLSFPSTVSAKTLTLNTNYQIEYIELDYTRLQLNDPVRTAYRPVFDCLSGCGGATRAVGSFNEGDPSRASIYAGPSNVALDAANFRSPRTNVPFQVRGTSPAADGYANGAHTIYVHMLQAVGIDSNDQITTAPSGAVYEFNLTATIFPSL